MCVFRIFSDTKMISILESCQQKEVSDLCICHFFRNTLYSLASLGSTTTPLITHVTLPVPLEDSLSLQVYQQCKKITNIDSLPPYKPTASSEVSEPMAFRNGAHSCTHHLIDKVLFFSHLSPTCFSFATKLSFVSPKIVSWCDVGSWMEKCRGWRDDYLAC